MPNVMPKVIQKCDPIVMRNMIQKVMPKVLPFLRPRRTARDPRDIVLDVGHRPYASVAGQWAYLSTEAEAVVTPAQLNAAVKAVGGRALAWNFLWKIEWIGLLSNPDPKPTDAVLSSSLPLSPIPA